MPNEEIRMRNRARELLNKNMESTMKKVGNAKSNTDLNNTESIPEGLAPPSPTRATRSFSASASMSAPSLDQLELPSNGKGKKKGRRFSQSKGIGRKKSKYTDFSQEFQLLNDISPMELEKIVELLEMIDKRFETQQAEGTKVEGQTFPRITVRRQVKRTSETDLKKNNSDKSEKSEDDNNSNNKETNDNKDNNNNDKPADAAVEKPKPRFILYDVKVVMSETYTRKDYDRRYKRKRRTKKEKDKIYDELADLRTELFGHPNAYCRDQSNLAGSFNRFLNKEDDEGVCGVEEEGSITESVNEETTEGSEDMDSATNLAGPPSQTSFPVGIRRASCEPSSLKYENYGQGQRKRSGSVSVPGPS